MQRPFCENELRNDDKKVNFYTGLLSLNTLKAVFLRLNRPFVTRKAQHITRFQEFAEFVMTLMKLRLNRKNSAPLPTELAHFKTQFCSSSARLSPCGMSKTLSKVASKPVFIFFAEVKLISRTLAYSTPFTYEGRIYEHFTCVHDIFPFIFLCMPRGKRVR